MEENYINNRISSLEAMLYGLMGEFRNFVGTLEPATGPACDEPKSSDAPEPRGDEMEFVPGMEYMKFYSPTYANGEERKPSHVTWPASLYWAFSCESVDRRLIEMVHPATNLIRLHDGTCLTDVDFCLRPQTSTGKMKNWMIESTSNGGPRVRVNRYLERGKPPVAGEWIYLKVVKE